jgi:hypothetical protein
MERYHNWEGSAEYYGLHSDLEDTKKVSGNTLSQLIGHTVTVILGRYKEQLEWEKKHHLGELLDTYKILGIFGPEGEITDIDILNHEKIIAIKQEWLFERINWYLEHSTHRLKDMKKEMDQLWKERPDMSKMYFDRVNAHNEAIRKRQEEAERENLKRLLEKYPDTAKKLVKD